MVTTEPDYQSTKAAGAQCPSGFLVLSPLDHLPGLASKRGIQPLRAPSCLQLALHMERKYTHRLVSVAVFSHALPETQEHIHLSIDIHNVSHHQMCRTRPFSFRPLVMDSIDRCLLCMQ